jgi:hypothetical protein
MNDRSQARSGHPAAKLGECEMLNVTFIYCYAECHYAKCRYAECRYAWCHYAECLYVECRYAKCR